MSPSTISFPTIFFISSILILISTPKLTIASSPPPLIQKACSNASINIDIKLCLRTLQSIPSIVSARDLFNLSLAIIEAGISNSTNTSAYVGHVLHNGTRLGPRERAAFRECHVAYGRAADSFRNVLKEVKAKEYVSPTYELIMVIPDFIVSCKRALKSQKIEDRIISRGNKIVRMFGMSAYAVVVDLEPPQSPPPPLPRRHY